MVEKKSKDLSNLIISTLDRKTFTNQHKMFRRNSDLSTGRSVMSDSFLLVRSRRALEKISNKVPENPLVAKSIPTATIVKKTESKTVKPTTVAEKNANKMTSEATADDGIVKDVIKMKKVGNYFTAYVSFNYFYFFDIVCD